MACGAVVILAGLAFLMSPGGVAGNTPTADPLALRATGMVLHMTNVGLLFGLVWQASGGGRQSGPERSVIVAATVAALLFAVHPLMTAVAADVGSRPDVLCATWLLLALLAAGAWMKTDHAGWLLATAALWIMGLVTRETAMVFPVVVLAYDWLSVPGTRADRSRRALWLHGPLFLIGSVAVAVRLVVFLFFDYRSSMTVDWNRGLGQVDVLVEYLRHVTLPIGQLDVGAAMPVTGLFDSRVVVGVVLIGAVLAVACRLRRLEGLVSFGLLSFLLFLVPSSVLAGLGRGEPIAVQRAYVAAMGLFLVAGAVVARSAPVFAAARRRIARSPSE
jgi:hypothetical protein